MGKKYTAKILDCVKDKQPAKKKTWQKTNKKGKLNANESDIESVHVFNTNKLAKFIKFCINKVSRQRIKNVHGFDNTRDSSKSIGQMQLEPAKLAVLSYEDREKGLAKAT